MKTAHFMNKVENIDSNSMKPTSDAQILKKACCNSSLPKTDNGQDFQIALTLYNTLMGRWADAMKVKSSLVITKMVS